MSRPVWGTTGRWRPAILLGGLALLWWLTARGTAPGSGAAAASDAGDPNDTLVVFEDPWLDKLDAPVFGLIVAMQAPPVSTVFQEQLQAITRHIISIEPGVAYVYPHNAVHSTVACIVNFMHNQARFTPEVRRRYVASWLSALRPCAEAAGFPKAAFSVTYGAPQLSGRAAFFPIQDPSHAVTAVRRCIRQAIDTDASLKPAGLDMTDDVRIPGILHSTLLRFRKAPRDAEQWQAAFLRVAASWRPVAVEVRAMHLAVEDRPYMHTVKDSAHMRLVWRFE
eukprot:EG_transcript_19704